MRNQICLTALSLFVLTACRHPAAEPFKQWQNNFRCTSADFVNLETLIRAHYSGKNTLEFRSTSAEAYGFASKVNELLGDCPVRILEKCAKGKEQADETTNRYFSTPTGPIEAFGISASETYGDSYDLSTGYWVVLKDEKVFRKTLDCFKAAL